MAKQTAYLWVLSAFFSLSGLAFPPNPASPTLGKPLTLSWPDGRQAELRIVDANVPTIPGLAEA